jgi:beta-glucosidase/6-phospho-beta-glucosidase/beta-galactosidase/glycosyltransferase involved in cell wall biosynthesis
MQLNTPTARKPASPSAGVAPVSAPEALAGAAEPALSRLPFGNTFAWGVGIESSTLPHLNIDQFAWTQHDRQWREDLGRVTEAGATHLRYAIPWHWIQPERRRFDWAAADERIDAICAAGITPLMDVMHFGTPLWLKQAVGDPEFPEALEELTERMVERYRDRVDAWCPVNEPLVCALFAGDFGFWPPHSRKWRGYMPVLARIAQATSRAIRATRRAAPEATVLLCDTAEHYKTRDAELRGDVALRNLRRFVMMDLVTGRVDHRHPLFTWLTSYGFNEIDLDWLRSNPQSPDVLGLDYYPHGDWQLDYENGRVRQRRADVPAGLRGVARQYFDRYGLPMLVTETSIEGRPINREIWLEQLVSDAAELRREGVPLLGLIWWPLLDHLDWDGAMTHRVGKLHEVGLYKLVRQADGALRRTETPLLKRFRDLARAGEEHVGKLEFLAHPVDSADEQLPPLLSTEAAVPSAAAMGLPQTNGHASGNGAAARLADPAPGVSAEPSMTPELEGIEDSTAAGDRLSASERLAGAVVRREIRETAGYGIVVFSHLRWGFVWQRPQQFLSRFARKHPVLFVEEPVFDLAEGAEPRLEMHRVMPQVTVAVLRAPHSWNRNSKLPRLLRQKTHEAIEQVNDETGAFDRPLLWYYSPMDSTWSLGHFENRGVVYDCMDELSQFTGAPPELLTAESRLIGHADVVFTGGYNLGEKKAEQHDNVHTFGCGVEVHHFGEARDRSRPVPADIDFAARPILGYFGVVDERLDYALIDELARRRPDWSVAMVGPVVKVDPNHLPHAPNLYWLGGRDYQVLPDYCRAFDVCLMPFAMNKATEFINPTKGLEYMATGRPIVSTPVRDVVKQWSDIVHIADTPDAFVSAVERALGEGPDSERVTKGMALAETKGWEVTVARMQELIREAITSPGRRSARAVEPVSEAQLAYTYVSTPGS